MDAMKTFAKIRLVPVAALLAGAAFLSGCANEGGPDDAGSGGSGTSGPVTVAITDAASDEIVSCRVEITNITLIRVGGAQVSLLTSAVEVDLASLSDLSQVLVSANVPAGLYTQANVSIDFANAACFLVGETAEATILDTSGAPVTGVVQLPLLLDAPLQIAVNQHRLLELDFDLDQSFTVDSAGNTVTVEPAFVLHVNPASPNQLLVAATLTSTNTATNTFVGAVHSDSGTTISSITFHITGSTIFQINGVPAVGSAGLTALAALPAGSSLQCFGTVASGSANFEVSHCQAGTGTFDGGTDIVQGHIVGRTGGPGADAVLQVLGHSINAAHTAFQYGTNFVVSTSFANTKVVRIGSSTAFDADDLNVGQRVRVFGTLTGTTMDATSATSVIRMERTRVFGVAAGAPAGSLLTLDLSHVDQLPETAFTWIDGGATPPDPNAFEANVGVLANGQGIVPGTFVALRGYFPPIDDVDADFDADSASNATTAPALLFVRNKLVGGFTVAVATTTTQIQLTITGAAAAGEVAIIDQGLVGTTPLPASPTPTLARPSMTGFYSLRDRGSNTILVFTQFSDFSSALQSDLAQGATLVQIGAHGTYDAGTNTIDAATSAAVIE